MTSSIPPLPYDETEACARFEQLQKKLLPLWKSIRELTDDSQTIVVVPSLAVDFHLVGPLLQAYEERFLFLLLLLRQPNARMVVVTSLPASKRVVDYYLDLLPRADELKARERLFFVTPDDPGPDWLAVKLLKRPKKIEEIRNLIPNKDRAHIVPFVTTRHERDLALKIGIPLYGTDPKFWNFGTKSGCRKLFTECGISTPFGFEDLTSLEDIVRAVGDVRRARPDTPTVMVKTDDGVSGIGNAVVDVRGADTNAEIRRRVEAMAFEDTNLDLGAYLQKFSHGGIVEERIVGQIIESPSAQLRVTPEAEVQLISTHDQLLSGPSGQKFSGCRFPADAAYAKRIGDESIIVGRRLAEEGILGRFAIDFVAGKQGDDWQVCAIELNLRKGGTTHPYLTLHYLTDGRYEPDTTLFRAASGQAKYFVATDNLDSPAFCALTIDDVFKAAAKNKLLFDRARQTGVVFHMLSALTPLGRIGLTAVGNSPIEADRFYNQTADVLTRQARIAGGN